LSIKKELSFSTKPLKLSLISSGKNRYKIILFKRIKIYRTAWRGTWRNYWFYTRHCYRDNLVDIWGTIIYNFNGIKNNCIDEDE
jgi:hypothetical protein